MRSPRINSCLIILFILAAIVAGLVWAAVTWARDFWCNYMDNKVNKIDDMDAEDVVSGGAIWENQVREAGITEWERGGSQMKSG